MNRQAKDTHRFQLRCCDVTVTIMGLLVFLGGLFGGEISWLLAGG